jgi:hypothetical protein
MVHLSIASSESIAGIVVSNVQSGAGVIASPRNIQSPPMPRASQNRPDKLAKIMFSNEHLLSTPRIARFLAEA